MIAVQYALGSISWEAGIATWAPIDGEPDPTEEARVAKLFSEPALGRESDDVDGAIAEIPVIVPPGSADHARAVIFDLPHVVYLIDDEPEPEGAFDVA